MSYLKSSIKIHWAFIIYEKSASGQNEVRADIFTGSLAVFIGAAEPRLRAELPRRRRRRNAFELSQKSEFVSYSLAPHRGRRENHVPAQEGVRAHSGISAANVDNTQCRKEFIDLSKVTARRCDISVPSSQRRRA